MQEITFSSIKEHVSINNLTIVLFVYEESIICDYLVCVCRKIEKLFKCCIFEVKESKEKKEIFPRISVYFKNNIIETLYGFNNFNKTSSFIKKYL